MSGSSLIPVEEVAKVGAAGRLCVHAGYGVKGRGAGID